MYVYPSDYRKYDNSVLFAFIKKVPGPQYTAENLHESHTYSFRVAATHCEDLTSDVPESPQAVGFQSSKS